MSDSTRCKREFRSGDWWVHLRQGPPGLEHVYYLTVHKGADILLATNESTNRRHKLHELFDTLEAGIVARAGKHGDERRERSRGGME